MTPDAQAQVSLYRQKAIAGTLTLEDMREAIRLIRAGRLSALAAVSKVRKGPPKTADEMLSELDDL